MKRNSMFAMIVLATMLAVTLAGCGGKSAPKGSAPAPAAKQAASEQASPTEAADVAKEQAAAAPQAEPTQEPPQEAQDEDLAFAEVKELSKFDSYRLKQVWSWKNEADEGSTETLIEFVRDPAAQRTVITGSDMDQGGMEIVKIGDTTFAKFGEEWIAMQRSSDEALQEAGWFGSPDSFLSDGNGKFVGRETINGMATKHYRYDQRALAPMAKLSQVDKATADVWVSTEHNVYVQVVMHWEGVSENEGKGVFDLRSNLYDINQPITIAPPQGAEKPAAPDDVPLFEGAAELAIMGTMINYKVQAAQDDVIAFYKDAMPGEGWTAQDATIPQMLQFAKGDRQVTVMINAEGDETSVVIMLSE